MSEIWVGSGEKFKTLHEGIAASSAGDTIFVRAGVYKNDTSTINHDLTIIGVDGKAHLMSTGEIGNGKAILVSRADLVVENLEFSGASVRHHNGAGIRYEGGDLTVRNSYFHGNENGILAASDRDGEIRIEGSEFAGNGYGDGRSHGIYVNRVGALHVSDSYFHDTDTGHHIKSRAFETHVKGSTLDDGHGNSSYSIDLPNGGNAVIEGNTLIQGAGKHLNKILISFGEEGKIHPDTSLTVEDNTFVNYRSDSIAIANKSGAKINVQNNDFFNVSDVVSGPAKLSCNYFSDAVPHAEDIPRPGADDSSSDGANGVPSASDDFLAPVSEDGGPIAIEGSTLLANDSDPDGDVLTLKSVGGSVGGSAVLTSSGDVVFAPASDFSGEAGFDYSVADGDGGEATASARFAVTPVNDDPVAADDGPVTTAAEEAVTIGVLVNDTDVEGDVLPLLSVRDGVHGTVTINSDETVTYTPSAGFSGVDAFTYKVGDGAGGQDTGTVNVTVSPGSDFAPDDLGDLVLWLDGSDVASVVDANSDGNMDAWSDLSGFGNDAFKGSNSAQPMIETTGLFGGRSALAFDGVDDVLAIHDAASLNTASSYDGKTLTLAFQTGSDVTDRQVLYEEGGGTRGLNLYVEGGEIHVGGWNLAETSWDPSFVSAALAADTGYVVTLTQDGASGTLSGHLNGALMGTFDDISYLHAHSADIGLGGMRDDTVFEDEAVYGSSGFSFEGLIGEAAFYNRALDDAERTEVETYLSDKWLNDTPATESPGYSAYSGGRGEAGPIVDGGETPSI